LPGRTRFDTIWFYIQLVEPVPWEQADVMMFPPVDDNFALWSPVRAMLSRVEGPIALENVPDEAALELLRRTICGGGSTEESVVEDRTTRTPFVSSEEGAKP
jgi:hypothetical protein